MAGIYIHIPFCLSKCAYCDFVSVPVGACDLDVYVDALCAEAAARAHELTGDNVGTVYIGGGTPTALGAARLTRILECVRACFNVDSRAEITTEANPGTVDLSMLRALREVGVNRLSLGVQSFDDGHLKALGRVHTAREAIDAVEATRMAGFDNISIDLMYGLPGQHTFELDTALALDVPHISLYALKLEEGTPLKAAADSGLIKAPDDDTQADMYDYAVSMLRTHGYKRYEMSNFARRGYESRHNTGYWRRTPYLGLGAAAHSLMDEARRANTCDITAYIARSLSGDAVSVSDERLASEDVAQETLMLGLRMEDGVLMEGLTLNKDAMQRFIDSGYMCIVDNHLRLTDKGFPVMNAILVELI